MNVGEPKLAFARIFMDFKLFASRRVGVSFERNWGESRATKGGPFRPASPGWRIWSSLIRCCSGTSRLERDTKPWLLLGVSTYRTHVPCVRRKYPHTERRRSTPWSTCRMYANYVQGGKEGTTPWREPVTGRQAVESISLYSRINHDIIFYGSWCNYVSSPRQTIWNFSKFFISLFRSVNSKR